MTRIMLCFMFQRDTLSVVFGPLVKKVAVYHSTIKIWESYLTPSVFLFHKAVNAPTPCATLVAHHACALRYTNTQSSQTNTASGVDAKTWRTAAEHYVRRGQLRLFSDAPRQPAKKPALPTLDRYCRLIHLDLVSLIILSSGNNCQ